MEEIDVLNLDRKKIYEWFNSFSNPSYGINTRIDVSNVVNYSKDNNLSFFIVFLYLITKSMNEVKEMRMRFVMINQLFLIK